MVWYGMVWYGMGWYGMVWYGMGWDGMGWDGMVWDGMGWDGMGWDGMGWDGMGWDGLNSPCIFLPLIPLLPSAAFLCELCRCFPSIFLPFLNPTLFSSSFFCRCGVCV